MSIGVAKVLRKARARMERPGTWCREYVALDAAGEPTDPDAPDAVCWCARGALEAEGCCVLAEGDESDGDDLDLAEWSFLSKEAKRWGYSSIEAFNDGQTQDEVLRLFDRAIASAEGAG
jgi:hypothetical protein